MNGNRTENTSIIDLLLLLKRDVFRTLNTAEVCIVRSIDGDNAKCEYITSSDIIIDAYISQSVEVQVNDVVLVVFTGQDFRTTLNAYKSGQALKHFETKQYHEKLYGVITSLIYRKGE